jgi:hypothetical protein
LRVRRAQSLSPTGSPTHSPTCENHQVPPCPWTFEPLWQACTARRGKPSSGQMRQLLSPVPAQMRQLLSPVPAQMRQGRAQSWGRRGRGAPSSGADAAGRARSGRGYIHQLLTDRLIRCNDGVAAHAARAHEREHPVDLRVQRRQRWACQDNVRCALPSGDRQRGSTSPLGTGLVPAWYPHAGHGWGDNMPRGAQRTPCHVGTADAMWRALGNGLQRFGEDRDVAHQLRCSEALQHTT